MSTQACHLEEPAIMTPPSSHPHQQTLLDLLRHGKHEEALARIGSNGEEVNQVHDGSTPLLVATTRGWEDVVVALVRHGANVNVTSELGETPLMRAIKCGKINAETIRLILEHGGKDTINVAAREDAFFAKWTALHFACDRDLNHNPVVAALLVAYGANVDSIAANSKSPVDMCEGREEFTKALRKPMEILKLHHFSPRDSLESGRSEEAMQIGSENITDSDEPRRSSLLHFGLHMFSKKPLEKKGSMISQGNHAN